MRLFASRDYLASMAAPWNMSQNFATCGGSVRTPVNSAQVLRFHSLPQAPSQLRPCPRPSDRQQLFRCSSKRLKNHLGPCPARLRGPEDFPELVRVLPMWKAPKCLFSLAHPEELRPSPNGSPPSAISCRRRSSPTAETPRKEGRPDFRSVRHDRNAWRLWWLRAQQ